MSSLFNLLLAVGYGLSVYCLFILLAHGLTHLYVFFTDAKDSINARFYQQSQEQFRL